MLSTQPIWIVKGSKSRLKSFAFRMFRAVDPKQSSGSQDLLPLARITSTPRNPGCMHYLFDLLFHLDSHLQAFIAQYGPWVYGLLFAIIFAETGFVVTPFLPGDSLLFTAGALAGTGVLDIRIVAPLLIVAAIAGDTVNYSVGHYVGPRIFIAHDRQGFWHRLLNRDHLNEAHAFYERHGGKAVVLAQFLPIIRTFVPFVAGCGAMTYKKFALFNVAAAALSVSVCM